MVLPKQNLESKDLSFTTSALPMLKQNNCTYNTAVKKALREEAKSKKNINHMRMNDSNEMGETAL